MQCYSYVAIIAVIVSLSYYFFEKWVTANPPAYSEGVPTTTGVLMLQGFAVRRRTEEKMNSIAT